MAKPVPTLPVPQDVVAFKNAIMAILSEEMDEGARVEELDLNAVANAVAKYVFDHIVVANHATVAWFGYLSDIGAIKAQ